MKHLKVESLLRDHVAHNLARERSTGEIRIKHMTFPSETRSSRVLQLLMRAMEMKMANTPHPPVAFETHNTSAAPTSMGSTASPAMAVNTSNNTVPGTSMSSTGSAVSIDRFNTHMASTPMASMTTTLIDSLNLDCMLADLSDQMAQFDHSSTEFVFQTQYSIVQIPYFPRYQTIDMISLINVNYITLKLS